MDTTKDGSRLLTWLAVALVLVLVAACGGAPSGATTPAAQRSAMDRADVGYAAEAEPMDEAGEIAYSGQLTADAELHAPARVTPTGGAIGGRPSPPPPAATATAAPPPAPPPATPPTGGQPFKPAVMAARLLIYAATLHLEVLDAAKAIAGIDQLAKDLGGYLVRRTQSSIVVRVPAETYRGALATIGKLGEVVHREETVSDVTDQFLDLQTRLRNARAMRDRLEKLLAQAKDVTEALAVERELGRITAEIERMEGRLKRLRELIAFSTITVEVREKVGDEVDSKVRLPFRWLNRLGLPNLLSL